MWITEQMHPETRRTVPQIYMDDDIAFLGWVRFGQTATR